MKLVARFELDETGVPLSEEAYGYHHYSISLFLRDVPEGTRVAWYILHESFRRPRRQVMRAVRDFEVAITSYGDFEIRVEYDRGGGIESFPDAFLLSSALASGHEEDINDAVRAAIAAIKAN